MQKSDPSLLSGKLCSLRAEGSKNSHDYLLSAQMLSSRLMRVGSGLSKLATRKKTAASSVSAGAKNLLPTFQEYVLWTYSHASVVRELVSMQVLTRSSVFLLSEMSEGKSVFTKDEWIGNGYRTGTFDPPSSLPHILPPTFILVLHLRQRGLFRFSSSNSGKRSYTCKTSFTTSGWRRRSS